MKSLDPTGDAECYAATLKGVSLGLMEGPFTYDGMKAHLPGVAINALRRFPIYRYPGAPPCDNAEENEENDRVETEDKLRTENSDFPLRKKQLDSELAASMPTAVQRAASSMKISLNDLRKAYWQFPSGHPGATVVAIWNPRAKKVEFFLVLGMPFGLVSSVLQFNRPMEFMQAAMRIFLAIPCAHYFDDWICASITRFAKSDDESLRKFVTQVIKCWLDDDKHMGPGDVRDVLGVRYDLTQLPRGVLIIRVKPERKGKITAMIDDMESSQRCSHATAATFRGKVYFTCTQAFGRAGRAPLQSFVSRRETSSHST